MNIVRCLKNDLLSISKLKVNHFFICKQFSSSKNATIKGNYRNCILVSQSNCIFENLAIEDWLYRYQEFEDNQLLLLWFNKPSIVIGRHQNPWSEVNLDECSKCEVDVARRNSGGGTVYHDLNNLNICFFTNKKNYNRRRNLEFIQSAIRNDFQINLNINKKEDLVLDSGEKVSGTASKLAFNKSYHHCTLLIDSNLKEMSKFIRKNSEFIVSNATKSVYSSVKNLSSINSDIRIENVIDSLVNNYKLVSDASTVQLVDFDEKMFPSLTELRNEISNWDWIYGKTPKFKIVKSDLINNQEYRCELSIVKGLIDQVELFEENDRLADDCLSNSLKGKRLNFKDCKTSLDDWLLRRTDFKSIYFSKLVLDAINAISFY